MVIVEFTYPRSRSMREWNAFMPGYFGRCWGRYRDGIMFDAGFDGCAYTSRRGGRVYKFIDMGAAVRNFHQQLEILEGTHHHNN